MKKRVLKSQFGSKENLVKVEKGEILRDTNGNLVRISKKADSHNDSSGGLTLDGVESVISDSYSQVQSGERKNNEKEEIVKLTKDQIKTMGEDLGLKVKATKSLSPSKAFDLLKESKDKLEKKYIDKTSNTPTSKYAENSLRLNLQFSKSIPKDEELYQYVLDTQEDNKSEAPELFNEQEAQYGKNKLPSMKRSQEAVNKGQNFVKDWIKNRWQSGLTTFGDGMRAYTMPSAFVLDNDKLREKFKQESGQEWGILDGFNIGNTPYVGRHPSLDWMSSVSTHESTHQLQNNLPDSLLNPTYSYIQNTLKNTKQKDPVSVIGQQNADYLRQPDEVHARIMQLREAAGIKPGQRVKSADLFDKEYNENEFNRLSDPLEKLRYIMTDDDIINIMNNTVSNNKNLNTTYAQYGKAKIDNTRIAYKPKAKILNTDIDPNMLTENEQMIPGVKQWINSKDPKDVQAAKALVWMNRNSGSPQINYLGEGEGFIGDPGRAFFDDLTNTMVINEGNTDDYFAELTHANQIEKGSYKNTPETQWIDWMKGNRLYEKGYKTPGHIEYQAHEVLEPQLKNQYRSLMLTPEERGRILKQRLSPKKQYGGKAQTFEQWKSSLPSNLRDTDTTQYNLRGAYQAGLQPELMNDGTYHLGSRNPQTGELLKYKNHPTYNLMVEAEKKAGYEIYSKNGKEYSRPMKHKKQYGGIDDVSLQGYRYDSPYQDSSSLMINGGTIDMSATPQDLNLIPIKNQQIDWANSVLASAYDDSPYEFDADQVLEVPVAQLGIQTNPEYEYVPMQGFKKIAKKPDAMMNIGGKNIPLTYSPKHNAFQDSKGTIWNWNQDDKKFYKMTSDKTDPKKQVTEKPVTGTLVPPKNTNTSKVDVKENVETPTNRLDELKAIQTPTFITRKLTPTIKSNIDTDKFRADLPERVNNQMKKEVEDMNNRKLEEASRKKIRFDFSTPELDLATSAALVDSYKTIPAMRQRVSLHTPLQRYINPDEYLNEINSQRNATLQNVNPNSSVGMAYVAQIDANAARQKSAVLNDIQTKNQQIEYQNQVNLANTLNQEQITNNQLDKQFYNESLATLEASRQQRMNSLQAWANNMQAQRRFRNDILMTGLLAPNFVDENGDIELTGNRNNKKVVFNGGTQKTQVANPSNLTKYSKTELIQMLQRQNQTL